MKEDKILYAVGQCETRYDALVVGQQSTIYEHLRTWEDVKKERAKFYGERFIPSGVACPQCNKELLVDKMVILTSYPPQQSYHCKSCGWHGNA